jgi:hypothetical protein
MAMDERTGLSPLSKEVGARFECRARFAAHLFGVFLFVLAFAPGLFAQCVDHPQQRTAVQFRNESSYELTFFVDEDEVGVAVESKGTSREQQVAPGEHLFRARAMVGGNGVWIWITNDIPQGNVCTWTVTDPEGIGSPFHK